MTLRQRLKNWWSGITVPDIDFEAAHAGCVKRHERLHQENESLRTQLAAATAARQEAERERDRLRVENNTLRTLDNETRLFVEEITSSVATTEKSLKRFQRWLDGFTPVHDDIGAGDLRDGQPVI